MKVLDISSAPISGSVIVRTSLLICGVFTERFSAIHSAIRKRTLFLKGRFSAAHRPENSRRCPSVSPIYMKPNRSEEHTSELQSHGQLVCRLLLEKKKQNQ